MQSNQMPAMVDPKCRTIWLGDQAPRFVGPDFDPFSLQKSLRIDDFKKWKGNIFILSKNFSRMYLMKYFLYLPIFKEN